jgi:phospholipid/cholesterol/gamma-HCH transport system ATP-binding protein
MAGAEPVVRFDHVVKSFGEQRVLDDVCFDVPAGTCSCILGRSGTGKSVALKHVIGLLSPDSGRVVVEGQDLASLGRRELNALRLHMGFLFQHAALFDSISVGENVAFPMRRHTEWPDTEILSRSREKLGQVGLAEAFDKWPADLSGGMRKRAGLARAMALDPPILLVDEPSAGLDPVTAAEIDELLASLKRDHRTTLIVVTHNMPSARALGDELLFLHRGQVLERGGADALSHSTHAIVRTFMASTGATG